MFAVNFGCDKSGTPGGPGATDSKSKTPAYGQADNTFNLTASAISLKQGDASAGTIGIKRGTDFDQSVTLAFEDLPKGVVLEPTAPVILSKGTDAKFTLKAGDDASLGDFTIKVIGHPSKGGDATEQFKLTVSKKDTFTLSVPFWTTALKQGETKIVTISISRDKAFDQDVSLKFDGLPKGISVEPTSAVIKNGEADTKISFKAKEDAGLGDFAVQITAHPTKGADASHEFKFTVAKK